MLGKPASHYVVGPLRRFKLLARWDLRQANKYLELHARFGCARADQARFDKTRTARLAHIETRWAALYVEVIPTSEITVDKVADGVEGVLSYQAANPNREPTTSGLAERRDRQIRDHYLRQRFVAGPSEQTPNETRITRTETAAPHA